MHDKYDVVIVGAGPAGITAAAWMSISGIKTLLVDKDSSPPKSGHADGIECRTFEVLETFGLVDAAWKESNKTVEIAYWGRVQQLFLDFIESHQNVTVLRPYEPHNLRFVTRGGSQVEDYPIQLEIARCGGKYSNKDEGHEPMQGPLNIIQARYLLGCDGSHSWVRKQCDLKLEGESANEHWGDAFNIGWKISSVVLGSATPAILETYQQERLPVGQALLDFDKRIYRMVSLKPDDQDFEAMKQTIQEENSSASGLGVIYRPNLLVHETQIHDLDSDRALRAGSRLPDMMVLNHSDGRPWRMHEILNKAGRWNLLIFGGNVSKKCQMGRVHKIAESLSRSSSLVGKINRASRGCGFSSIELTLIHCASRDIVELDDLPRIFTPSQGPMGIDYTKIFVDTASHTGLNGMVYRDLAIPKMGCIMLIRPDQHVAFRGGLESVSEMDHFLAKFWLCN
ncbi:phenol 2-monooxygenase [Fusarium proliferatum]|nr:phenol 2-monooxygenase [Fusarium proliferatum]